MSFNKSFLKCMFGPNIIKTYGENQAQYQVYAMEKLSNKMISYFLTAYQIAIYTSPLLFVLIYHKGYFSAEGVVSMTKIFTTLGTVLVSSYCCRAISRYSNPEYMSFITTLESARNTFAKEALSRLNTYEFDFRHRPIEFKATGGVTRSNSNSKQFSQMQYLPFQSVNNFIEKTISGVAYVAIHTFGIKLIYPGSISALQLLFGPILLQGRSRLIQVKHGRRHKILSSDNNEIDTMFIDKRRITANGDTLVICCEGNAGFYEIGVMDTPLEANYSVLGWNHPGFGASTGRPYPSQEQNAVDAVVQFAIKHLGFSQENIILFGWSIGGYTTSWAAMHYPNLKGVILDATFDDLLPLAYNYMPSSLSPIVRVAIRKYANLNIFENLSNYAGPILLIRRVDDEIICLRPGDISTNRGNHLLLKLLSHRYPKLFGATQIDVLRTYLAVTSQSQDDLLRRYNVDSDLCQSLLRSYIAENGSNFPMEIDANDDLTRNQLVLYLARTHMTDFQSTHCINLPTEAFQLPWNAHADFDFT